VERLRRGESRACPFPRPAHPRPTHPLPAQAGDDARVLAVKDEASLTAVEFWPERTAYDARSMLKGMPGNKKAGAVKIKESGAKKDAAAGVERGEGSGKKARVETTPPARKQPSRLPPSQEKVAGKRKQSSPSKCV